MGMPLINLLLFFIKNIRSVRNTIQDIANIVDEFDIICFTERHLDHSILLGFRIKHLDRNCHGGGIIL